MVTANANISYHQRQLAVSADNKEIELIRLVDGATCKMLYDGPHRPGPDGQMPPPGVGTSRILKNLRKKDADGRPIWYALKSGIRIYDPQIEDWREVPALDDEAKKRMAAHIRAREERNDVGSRAMRMQIEKKQAEQNAATEAVVVNALGKLLGKADGAKPKGGAA